MAESAPNHARPDGKSTSENLSSEDRLPVAKDLTRDVPTSAVDADATGSGAVDSGDDGDFETEICAADGGSGPCGGRGGRKSKKRAAILEAARALFCREGVMNTSMDAVAAEAGVSKATLYAHFPSKVDLFGEVLRDFASARLPMSDDLLTMPVQQALRRLAWRFLDLILAPESLATYRTLMAHGEQFPELVAAFKAAGPELVCASVGRYFATLCERGELRGSDPALMAEVFLHMVKGDPHAHALIGVALSREETARWVEETVGVFIRAYAVPAATRD